MNQLNWSHNAKRHEFGGVYEKYYGVSHCEARAQRLVQKEKKKTTQQISISFMTLMCAGMITMMAQQLCLLSEPDMKFMSESQ
jgi:hypothetical protein